MPQEAAAPEQAPLKQGVGIIGKLARLVFGLLLIGVLAIAGAYWYFQQQLIRPLSFDQRIYSINPGDSLSNFSQLLIDSKVISESYSLRLWAKQQNLSGKLHTGDYRFAKDQNLKSVLEQVTTSGGQVVETITLVEGNTLHEWRQQFAASKAESTIADWDDSALAERVTGDASINLEGRLFPDTYQFTSGTSDVAILKRAYTMMESQLESLWDERDKDLPLKSAYEALILASIIEKETGLAEERPLIGGVFVNRLRKGMLLQTDPTVIYGIGQSFDGNITRKHLRTDTPYNTYTRKGLPPTPICMPSLAAIKAALHPQETDAYYFVAKGGGAHQFSETLQAHNRAVRKYQLKQN